MTDVNWRRVFTISSLIFALALVCGSIYLHLQQKNHFGRLRRIESMIQAPEMVEAVAVGDDIDIYASEFYDESSEVIATSPAMENPAELYRKNVEEITPPPPAALPPPPTIATTATTIDSSKQKTITEPCIECICQVATECKAVLCDSNMPCGSFRISKPYWIDAGSPSLKAGPNNTTPPAHVDVDENTGDGYGDCVNDASCARRTVAAFVGKYARDCNHDGVIDCRDHVALHILGPQGCLRRPLSSPFDGRMNRCLARFDGRLI